MGPEDRPICGEAPQEGAHSREGEVHEHRGRLLDRGEVPAQVGPVRPGVRPRGPGPHPLRSGEDHGRAGGKVGDALHGGRPNPCLGQGGENLLPEGVGPHAAVNRHLRSKAGGGEGLDHPGTPRARGQAAGGNGLARPGKTVHPGHQGHLQHPKDRDPHRVTVSFHPGM